MVQKRLKTPPDDVLSAVACLTDSTEELACFAVKLAVAKKLDFGCKSILTFANIKSYPPRHVE